MKINCRLPYFRKKNLLSLVEDKSKFFLQYFVLTFANAAVSLDSHRGHTLSTVLQFDFKY